MTIKQAVVILTVAIITYKVLEFYENKPFDGASLANKNVIVVGASSGIGEQMAYWYATYGANVFIVARREEKLKQVVAECKTLVPPGGGQVTYLTADMSIEGDRIRVIQSALEFFNDDIDQIILNHAYFPPVHTWNGSDTQLAHLKGILNVNVVSFVHLAALALPSLKRSNGSVGIIGSLTGRVPFPLMLEYQASKFALDGFFSGLRFEFKATNQNVSITFCTIGVIGTDAGIESIKKFLEKTDAPSGFFLKLLAPARPEDAAHAIISATTQRKGELYFPRNQLLWIQAVIRSLFPELLEMFDLGLTKRM